MRPQFCYHLTFQLCHYISICSSIYQPALIFLLNIHNIYSSGLLRPQFLQKVLLSMYTSRGWYFLPSYSFTPQLTSQHNNKPVYRFAEPIYTQACPRTSLFCFLLYQLSLWWVKYSAQPEAITSRKHAVPNAP